MEIQGQLEDAESSVRHLRVWLKAMEKHAGYKQLTNRQGQPFKTYEAFCQERQPFGLGYESDVIDRIVKERESAQALAEQATPLAPSRRPTKEEQGDKVDNVNLIQGGNRADYLTRRIARDRPDILERMKAGEYASVRAAAIDAGIVKVPTRLETMQRAWRLATPEERKQIREWVIAQMGDKG